MPGAPAGPSRPCHADPMWITLRVCKRGTTVARGATPRRTDEVTGGSVPVLSRR
jgi:hypothetical protein